MTVKMGFLSQTFTSKLKEDQHSCPSCGSKSFEIETDFLESVERGVQDILLKTGLCNDCGANWDEEYKVSFSVARVVNPGSSKGKVVKMKTKTRSSVREKRINAS